MKKNLFLLFSIYFFVLQPLIIGVLRGQANFFRLGAINLVAIILIWILYNTVENSPEEVKNHEKSPVKETRVAFHEQFRAAAKEHRKQAELWFPLIISIIVALLIFLLFRHNGGAAAVMAFFAWVLWFIVFLSLTLMFKHRFTKSFWKLIGTKIYLAILVVSLVTTILNYAQVHKDFDASFQDYIAQNFLGQERIPVDGYVFTGEWTVLWSGLWDTTIQDVSSDVFSGMLADSDIQEETGTILGTSSTANSEQLTTNNTISPSTVGNQKLMDAVLYLIDKYNVPLVTTPNVSFTYVTTKNPYYTERRTAYANKMIGKTTNPSKYIVCESYIVMKWLLEKWNVVYTSSNVLTKFRDEAVKRDALNGCVKGKIVTDKTL